MIPTSLSATSLVTMNNSGDWLQRCYSNTEQCFVTNIVLCELVWVLRSKPYNYSKDEILSILDIMLQTSIFEFENRSVVYQALQRTRQGKGDFSDYLINAIALSLGCQETATFDRKLRGKKGFQFLSKDSEE